MKVPMKGLGLHSVFLLFLFLAEARIHIHNMPTYEFSF